MIEEFKNFLSSIGFGKNEIEVYVALISMGQSSVVEISKKTGIHRSNVYEALRKLLKEGMIFEFDKPKKLFYARNPKDLLNYLKQKEMDLNKIIQNLETKIQKKDESKIGISKGIFAVREGLNKMLEQNKPIYVYGIPSDTFERIGPVLKEFHKERIKRKIIMKHIYNSKSPRIDYLNRIRLTEAACLSQKYDSNVTTNICGDRVLLFIWEEKDITIVEIIDKAVAEAYYRYFEILWKKSKKNL